MVVSVCFCLGFVYLVYRLQKSLLMRRNSDDILSPTVVKRVVLWGAVGAPILACLVSWTFGEDISSTLNSKERAVFSSVLFGPFLEELLKGLAVLAMALTLKTKRVRTFVLIGALTGVGFQLAEVSLGVLGAAVNGNPDAVGYQLVMRGVVLSLLHPTCTALTGLGIGYAVRRSSIILKLLLGCVGFSAAYFLHFWNNAVALSINMGERLDQSEFFGVHLVLLMLMMLFSHSRSETPPKQESTPGNFACQVVAT